jgi:actin-related protein 7
MYVIVFQANKEQLVQLMFEKFNISGFYASEQSVLSLYAVGRISGCTVDIGHGKIGNQPTSEAIGNFSLQTSYTLKS